MGHPLTLRSDSYKGSVETATMAGRCDDMLVKVALDVVTEAVNGVRDPLVSKVSLFKASSLSGAETHGRSATIC